jgi:hypothetical protein
VLGYVCCRSGSRRSVAERERCRQAGHGGGRGSERQ